MKVKVKNPTGGDLDGTDMTTRFLNRQCVHILHNRIIGFMILPHFLEKVADH